MEEQENTEEIKSFEDLSKTEKNENDMILPEKEVDDFGRSYATGKRKDAVARVWLKQGPGNITINGKSSDDYFARPVLRMLINQPLVASERKEQFDVVCSVTGGGLSGQAGAVRHGISKALVLFEPELKKVLKSGGFLTRDSRVVERKKYGRRKARRSSVSYTHLTLPTKRIV